MKYQGYCIREIEEKDHRSVENVTRSCLIEFGANHGETGHYSCDVCYIRDLQDH
ncbi:MAG: hypothetical protein Q4B57_01185 [Eubacteriales bacterium]|nr:hypothetical protein [Eubacteriales bacterium]